MMIFCPISTVYLEDSFIKSGVFSVTELVRVSRSKYITAAVVLLSISNHPAHTHRCFQVFSHLSLIAHVEAGRRYARNHMRTPKSMYLL